MPYLNDDIVRALRGPLNLGIFFRLGTQPALRLWLGVNHSPPIGIPALDPEGTTYVGAGALLSVPELETLLNGIADRVEFSISGLDASVTDNVNSENAKVLGAPVHVGIAALDERYQPKSQIVPVWVGTADYWTEAAPVISDPMRPATRTLSLVASSGDTARARPRLVSFTDAAQKLLYPSDRFFERVARYVQAYVVSWPRF
jgi:hypothetical protein